MKGGECIIRFTYLQWDILKFDVVGWEAVSLFYFEVIFFSLIWLKNCLYLGR